jgi:hypothetical protein
VLLRIKKRKLLRIIQKDIDIVAFTMIKLEHQRCAAAKRPVLNDNLLRISLANELTRDPKQLRPICPMRHVVHAASG